MAENVAETPEFKRKFEIIRSVGEECVTEDDLTRLLLAKESFRVYDGFEPSGRMHIAQGLFKAINVNKLTDNGAHFVFWVADWFALMNDKMGGDLEKIKVVGEYFVEVWKAAGMKMSRVDEQGVESPCVEFLWTSEAIQKEANRYWPLMLDISRRFTLARLIKCGQIMGRGEGNLTAAQILYPLMQCTDIFFLRADICQLGVDQRKVNMLAREFCDLRKQKNKPVILSHHMISGLKKGQVKMSKSDPDSAIFMEDSEEDIIRKISNAWCPKDNDEDINAETDVDSDGKVKNPCFDYIGNIFLSSPESVFSVNGHRFTDIDELRQAFNRDEVTEEQIKSSLSSAISKALDPVRRHFEENDRAKEVLRLTQLYKSETSGVNAKKSKSFVQIELTKYKEYKGKCDLFLLPVVCDLELKLQYVLDATRAIQALRNDNIVVIVPDLSTFVYNGYSEDRKTSAEKIISQVYDVLIAAIKSGLAEEILQKLVFIKESDLMYEDPSGFWITAINIGRFLKVNQITNALINDPTASQTQPVGPLVALLMQGACIASLNPKQVSCFSGKQENCLKLINNYFNSYSEILSPVLVVVDQVELTLMADGKADAELLLTDTVKMTVKKKIKKAFCEPGNIEFNPILKLLSELCLRKNQSFTANEVEYTSVYQLLEDFSKEKLHPKDLKEVASKVVVDLFNRIETVLAEAEVKKSLNGFQRYVKKVQKKK